MKTKSLYKLALFVFLLIGFFQTSFAQDGSDSSKKSKFSISLNLNGNGINMGQQASPIREVMVEEYSFTIFDNETWNFNGVYTSEYDEYGNPTGPLTLKKDRSLLVEVNEAFKAQLQIMGLDFAIVSRPNPYEPYKEILTSSYIADLDQTLIFFTDGTYIRT